MTTKYPWWVHLRKRLRIKLEWRDIWLGGFIGREVIYVCLLPCVVIIWRRHWLGPRCSDCQGRGVLQGYKQCPACRGKGWFL